MTKLKATRRKEMIMSRDKRNRDQKKRINKTKTRIFEKSNEIEKLLPRLTRKHRRLNLLKTGMEKETSLTTLQNRNNCKEIL